MVYDLFKIILPRLFRLLCRCKVSGQENIPKSGGVIIAANHISNWDPPVVASFVPRHVHFMAKQELFEVPVFGWVIRKMHAFPVRRGTADRTAIKTAIRLLEEGHCLGLFPEGTRSKDGALQKAEPGLALIAMKAGVPVVPAVIVGTERICAAGSFFPKLKIRYGKPLQLAEGQTDKADLQNFSQRIMDEIERLRKEARQ